MSEIFELISQEIPRLRRYARALTRDVYASEDLVQDCLVRGLAKIHLWQEDTDLRAWLFTILHNQYVNTVRRAVREGSVVEISDAEPSMVAKPAQIPRLELRDLERALAKVPYEQRQVLLLIGMEGMSYEEVAEIMDVPVGTIRSRLSRGRDLVRELMGETEQRSRRKAEVTPKQKIFVDRATDAPSPRPSPTRGRKRTLSRKAGEGWVGGLPRGIAKQDLLSRAPKLEKERAILIA